MKTQRVIACHLLNDFSGSPKVLAQSLEVLAQAGYNVHLFTSKNTTGFLSSLHSSIQTHQNWYVFHKNNGIRLLFYSFSQCILFLRLLFFIQSNDIVYVNTVLPFGAALAAKIRGVKVIYHIHETTVNPAILKSFLVSVIRHCAHHLVYVSEYVRTSHHFNNLSYTLIYNALDERFIKEATVTRHPKKSLQTLLMICSLKAYKGVFEFIKLAVLFPNLNFRLVLNASKSEIELFFKNTVIPKNCQLFEAQSNLHPFYAQADLICNFSNPEGWIETFGLTIIEGMVYGLPSLVPKVGGIVEVIENNVTGFEVDSRDLPSIETKINLLLSDAELYQNMSNAARTRVNTFYPEQFALKTVKLFDQIR